MGGRRAVGGGGGHLRVSGQPEEPLRDELDRCLIIAAKVGEKRLPPHIDDWVRPRSVWGRRLPCEKDDEPERARRARNARRARRSQSAGRGRIARTHVSLPVFKHEKGGLGRHVLWIS